MALSIISNIGIARIILKGYGVVFIVKEKESIDSQFNYEPFLLNGEKPVLTPVHILLIVIVEVVCFFLLQNLHIFLRILNNIIK